LLPTKNQGGFLQRISREGLWARCQPTPRRGSISDFGSFLEKRYLARARMQDSKLLRSEKHGGTTPTQRVYKLSTVRSRGIKGCLHEKKTWERQWHYMKRFKCGKMFWLSNVWWAGFFNLRVEPRLRVSNSEPGLRKKYNKPGTTMASCLRGILPHDPTTCWAVTCFSSFSRQKRCVEVAARALLLSTAPLFAVPCRKFMWGWGSHQPLGDAGEEVVGTKREGRHVRAKKIRRHL